MSHGGGLESIGRRRDITAVNFDVISIDNETEGVVMRMTWLAHIRCGLLLLFASLGSVLVTSLLTQHGRLRRQFPPRIESYIIQFLRRDHP